jgi:hypothetical protein
MKNKFSFKNITFLDLAFLFPENKYYDYGIGEKGYIPNYRPSVYEDYSNAATFILTEDGADHVQKSI